MTAIRKLTALLLAAATVFPAWANDWVDVTGRDNIAALYSDTTLRGEGWTGYYRADGRGFIVLANGTVQGRKWFIQGEDLGCATLDQGPTLCFRFQRERANPSRIRITEVARGVQATALLERGVPDLSAYEKASVAAAPDESWRAALGDPAQLLPALREEVVRVPLLQPSPADGVDALVATLFQPPGPGPFPVIVLSHGSPGNPQHRAEMGRYRLVPQIEALVLRGFAVLVPMRRGYGATGGSFRENIGDCAGGKPEFAAAGAEGARDLLSAIAFIRTRASLDAQRIVLMGQSAGGFASLAAAAQSPRGVVAVLNLAGGRGGNGRDGRPCAPEQMAQVIGGYARVIAVPVLWFYAENDRYFGPAAVRGWFKAFEDAGGRGRLVVHPPYGADGHLLFYKAEARPIWTAAMEEFFRGAGLAQLAGGR